MSARRGFGRRLAVLTTLAVASAFLLGGCEGCVGCADVDGPRGNVEGTSADDDGSWRVEATFTIQELALSILPVPGYTSPDRARLTEIIETSLRATDAFRDDGRVPVEIYVDVTIGRHPSGTGHLMRVQSNVRAQIAGAIPTPELIIDSFTEDPEHDVSAEAIEEALREHARVAAASMVLVSDTDDAIVAALGDPRPELVIHALREMDRRRLRHAAGEIVPLLQHEERRVFLAAVGALTQLEHVASVPAIIDAVDSRDAETVLAVVPAIGRLGGVSAVGYIQALAAGHDDHRVRQQARSVLADMGHPR